jgi:hypothetical protein
MQDFSILFFEKSTFELTLTEMPAIKFRFSLSLVFLNVLSVRPSISCRKIQDIHELSSLDCANF